MRPQIWVGDSKPNKNKMVPVKDEYYFGKPHGGFWTSPLKNNTSPWLEFTNDIGMDSYTNDKCTAWVLIPKQNVNVIKINSKKDIMQFSTRNVDRYKTIDYVSAFEHCDAIHVTNNGIQYNEFREWDCESILWDTWKFKNCIKLEKYIN